MSWAVHIARIEHNIEIGVEESGTVWTGFSWLRRGMIGWL
jgi:hypothetical protein